MTFEDLQKLTLEWADDKDLLHEENAEKQFMKFIEEVFEFKTEFDYLFRISLFKDAVEDKIEVQKWMKLEMGDVFVTLIILCEQIGIDPVECLSMAYKKISKRTGKTIGGQFIKSEDLEDE